MVKFQVEQWIPPFITEKIKQGEWLHLVTQVDSPLEHDECISIGYLQSNSPEFFVNGELVKEDIESLNEVESRLQTGL
jgi:hypothetical protein